MHVDNWVGFAIGKSRAEKRRVIGRRSERNVTWTVWGEFSSMFELISIEIPFRWSFLRARQTCTILQSHTVRNTLYRSVNKLGFKVQSIEGILAQWCLIHPLKQKIAHLSKASRTWKRTKAQVNRTLQQSCHSEIGLLFMRDDCLKGFQDYYESYHIERDDMVMEKGREVLVMWCVFYSDMLRSSFLFCQLCEYSTTHTHCKRRMRRASASRVHNFLENEASGC